MTGFARVRKLEGEREAVVSLKSVNHRGLDVHFRMPPELDGAESALRAAIKRHVTRGHIQVQVKYVGAQEDSPALINQPLLESYLEAFHRTSAIHGLHTEPDLNLALQVPGMFQAAEEEPDESMEGFLVAAVEEALGRLNEFREREGLEIASEMRQRDRLVLQNARRMEELRGRAAPEFQKRLTERLEELLGGVGLEPQRLAQEVAYLAERTDISEELTRLKVHSTQLESLLSGAGEVGKKLDFMLQEMHRETNTILSKSTAVGEPGLEITDLALGVKAEIEKIREQGLNLE